jgi:hypothetical protein
LRSAAIIERGFERRDHAQHAGIIEALAQTGRCRQRPEPRIVESADDHQRAIQMPGVLFNLLEDVPRIATRDIEGRIDLTSGTSQSVEHKRKRRE